MLTPICDGVFLEMLRMNESSIPPLEGTSKSIADGKR